MGPASVCTAHASGDSPASVRYLTGQRAMTASTTAATAASRDPAEYDDDALERLADLLAERLALRLGGPTPVWAEPLVDAAAIARLHGKTRSWVYEHAGELGAVRFGSGPRPRLAFSPIRVAEQLESSTSQRRSHSRRLLSVGAAASGPVAPRRARRCCMCDPSKPRSARRQPAAEPISAPRARFSRPVPTPMQRSSVIQDRTWGGSGAVSEREAAY